MKTNIINTCIAATLLGLSSVSAQAATIWLTPTTQTIGLNDVAILEMHADASDVGGFLAGGLDMFYDNSILRYNGDFAFDAAFPTDLSFSRLGDDCATVAALGCNVTGDGEINGIAFGSFTGLAANGPTLVGTLSFTGIGLGISPVTMTDNDTPAGAWFATDGSGPLVVEYGIGVDFLEEAEVKVVPVPAAAWLMLSGLGLLGGLARRKANA